jgi:hypothetical protein
LAALNAGAGLANIPTPWVRAFADVSALTIRADVGLNLAEVPDRGQSDGVTAQRAELKIPRESVPQITPPLGNDIISKLSFLDRASIEHSVTQFLAELGVDSSLLAFEPSELNAWLIAASAVVTAEAVRRWRSRRSSEARSVRSTNRIRPTIDGLS